MENLLPWVATHWVDILAVYGAVVGVATMIVGLTPSTRDDAILAKIVGFLNHFSTLNPKSK